MKLQQTDLMQTGVAIFRNSAKEQVQVPLFSSTPLTEAQEIVESLEGYTIEHVFYSNSMFLNEPGSIGNRIKEVVENYGFLPEDLMEDLKRGFVCVTGEFSVTPSPVIHYC